MTSREVAPGLQNRPIVHFMLLHKVAIAGADYWSAIEEARSNAMEWHPRHDLPIASARHR
jgi:hypothetical protein